MNISSPRSYRISMVFSAMTVNYIEGQRRTIASVFAACSAEAIRNTLTVLCERTVNKGNDTYMALFDEKGRHIALPYHTRGTVARLLDGSLFATRDHKYYALEKIPDRHDFSPQADPEDTRPKPKPVRPKMPANHPLSFQKQKLFKENDALMKSLAPYYKSPKETEYS